MLINDFFTVEEQEPAMIISGSSAIQLQMGSDAMLPCVAIGSPTPAITWYKVGGLFLYNKITH